MATLFLLQLSAPPIVTLNPRNRTIPVSSRIVRRGSTISCAENGSRWDGDGRFGFNREDDDGDFDGQFGFTRGEKRRVWWSDDDDVDDEYYDEGEIDGDDEFSIFKVLGAFGWMLPAIGVSFLLGTGPNAVLMALAVPLAQSILSLVIDKAWSRTGDRSRTRFKSRIRRRTYPRDETASKAKANYAKREGKQGSVDASSDETVTGGVLSFGGWDDLDRPKRSQNVPWNKSIPRQDVSRKLKKDGKLSRLGRVKEKPLFLRLIIAAFPFLGSWTRLLF